MARTSAPCCELRTHPDGIKAYGCDAITPPMGRRGKPVKKLRLITAEKAFALAHKSRGALAPPSRCSERCRGASSPAGRYPGPGSLAPNLTVATAKQQPWHNPISGAIVSGSG